MKRNCRIYQAIVAIYTGRIGSNIHREVRLQVQVSKVENAQPKALKDGRHFQNINLQLGMRARRGN